MPRAPIMRAEGVTDAERYLDKLCQRSFLSLWSYPSPFRDQGIGKGQGKEICDLLVVFGDDVLLFSDKHIAFPDTGDLQRDWQRWFRRAVVDSAKQLRGAERWIQSHPDRIFIDRAYTVRIPVDLPTTPRFHRIVVAHGAAQRCVAHFGGGSGSLMIFPSLVGDGMPFTVGYPAADEYFVHVLDDTTLDLVLAARDTVTDFIHYLRAKEELIASGRLLSAAGEEELLAHYLEDIDKTGEHAFVFPDEANAITIDEGFWDYFSRSPERAAQLEADKVSYAWDALIEQFTKHALAGTQYYTSHSELSEQEKGLRLLARESRLVRRILGAALVGLIESTPPEQRATRLVAPNLRSPTDTHFLFLLLPRLPTVPEEQYREVRRNLLAQYCQIVKLERPSARDIVGIAMAPHTGSGNSEDFLYFDARQWTAENAAEARSMKEHFIAHGLLGKRGYSDIHVSEYPTANTPGFAMQPRGVVHMKGRERNSPCPCGSGRKYKRCCGAGNV